MPPCVGDPVPGSDIGHTCLTRKRRTQCRQLGTKRSSATRPTMSVSGPKHTSQADSPTSENDQRTHPLQTIRTTRTVADADARNPND
jgi:hypothetical protein